MFESKDLFEFDQSPIDNFNRLFEEAKKHPGIDPTAMTLATIDERGRPNARIVLLKQIEKGDFVFYTNYQSTKARELDATARAAVVFHWEPLAVQVRIEGSVTKNTRSESEAYFRSRPRLSQLGAWASRQSEIIESYDVLQKRLDAVTEKFKDREIPCPENWGGYRISPEFIEFWFGMEGRLHHRYLYERSGEHWLRTMKSP